MKKTSSIRPKILLVYSVSLVMFVIVVIGFSYVYQQNYLKNRMEIAKDVLINTEMTVSEAAYELNTRGFAIKYYGEEIGYKTLSQQRFNVPIHRLQFKDDNTLIINGYLEADVNSGLIKEFVSDLYLIIITTVIIYICVTLVFIQYFIFQIINPLIRINDELKQISEFKFESNYRMVRNGSRGINNSDEIQSLFNSVENIKISLRSYNKNRAALVSALVHELKSPVATISSVLQLNKMGHEKYDDIETRRIIEESIETISVITKMSLEIFEKQSIYKIINMNVDRLIDEQINKIKPTIDEKKLDVHVIKEDVTWPVDEESFNLIISNILTNICKYSKDDSIVDIFISSDAITFSNVIAETFTSGTGNGLKIIGSLLKDMNMSLEYFESDGKYHVIITKKL